MITAINVPSFIRGENSSFCPFRPCLKDLSFPGTGSTFKLKCLEKQKLSFLLSPFQEKEGKKSRELLRLLRAPLALKGLCCAAVCSSCV